MPPIPTDKDAIGKDAIGKDATDNEPTDKERIWQVISMIPKGSVATYGQVATLAGLPGRARLVGTCYPGCQKTAVCPGFVW